MPRTGAGSTNLSPAIHIRTRPIAKRSSGSPIRCARSKSESKIFIARTPLVLLGDGASEVGPRHPRDCDIACRLRRCHGRGRCQEIGSDAGVECDRSHLPRATVKRARVARPDTGDPELTRGAVGYLVERVLASSGRQLRRRNHGAHDDACEKFSRRPAAILYGRPSRTLHNQRLALSDMAVEAKLEAPVLVVDDDPKIQALVSTYLQREGLGVVTASDGAIALEEIRRVRPRLVVLDLMLPGLDGMSVLRQLRQESDVPVLILSARGSTPDRVYGITEGADDYLGKPFSPAELVVRVKAILRRATSDARAGGRDAILQHGDLTIDLGRRQVLQGDHEVSLTSAELRILSTLIAARGRVLSRQQLQDALYEETVGAALDRTIDVHIGRLRAKLRDDPRRPRYVVTVRGGGYRAAEQ